jgi:hypothetical protein
MLSVYQDDQASMFSPTAASRKRKYEVPDKENAKPGKVRGRRSFNDYSDFASKRSTTAANTNCSTAHTNTPPATRSLPTLPTTAHSLST